MPKEVTESYEIETKKIVIDIAERILKSKTMKNYESEFQITI